MSTHLGRTIRLRQAMAREGIDGIILISAEHIYYMADFWGYWPARKVVMLLPLDGAPTLIVPRLEAAQARCATWIDDVRDYTEWPEAGHSEDPIQVLAALLAEKGLDAGRLGVEEDSLSVALFERMKRALPRAHWADGGSLVEAMRLIKEPAELEIMRQAGLVAAAEMVAAAATIRPGVPEYEVTLAVQAAGSRLAADLLGPDERLISPLIGGIQILSAGGERAEWVHARASTRRLQLGDLVALCFCETAHYRGYHLGFDRPVIVGGAASVAQAEILDATLAAHDAALAAIRPGVEAREVDRQAAAVFEARGVLSHRMLRSGRGVGVAYAERPELRDSDRTVLRPGMTFSVEPGVYVQGVGAARFGETVAVTETGYELLVDCALGWRGR